MTHEGKRVDETTSESGDRRGFLRNASRAAMAAGLLGGYGGFAVVAGRYLYPAKTGEVLWQFVSEVDGIEVGGSIRYRGPSGETVNITRRGRDGDADDFIALSSTCPHLGCQVRWEPHNDRFFCPCHSGVFDPSGKAIAGPPPRFGAAGQKGCVIEGDAGIAGPGHDPCLASRHRRGEGPGRGA